MFYNFTGSEVLINTPSKVIKVSTKGKVQEFITLHFLRIWGCLKEFLGKLKNNSELQCLDQEHLGVKYNHMLWKEIWVMSSNSKNWDHIYYTCTIISATSWKSLACTYCKLICQYVKLLLWRYSAVQVVHVQYLDFEESTVRLSHQAIYITI